jgi:hypothetical protein
MRPTNALAMLDLIATAHTPGHRCPVAFTPDARMAWFNPHAGDREKCPTLVSIETIRADVTTLHTQVHEAAHDIDLTRAVAAAMLSTPFEELDAETGEGWIMMARLAIEALAARLDRDPVLEARVLDAMSVLGGPDD